MGGQGGSISVEWGKVSVGKTIPASTIGNYVDTVPNLHSFIVFFALRQNILGLD